VGFFGVLFFLVGLLWVFFLGCTVWVSMVLCRTGVGIWFAFVLCVRLFWVFALSVVLVFRCAVWGSAGLGFVGCLRFDGSRDVLCR
jgi:hypothetical protein